MKTYRFNNKKEKRNNTLVNVMVAITAIVVLLNVNINMNKYFLYMIFSISGFIYTLVSIAQASRTIKEVSLDGNIIRLTVFNKIKKELSIEKSKISICISNEKIIFTSNQFRSIAYKKMIEESSEWEDLVQMLKSNL